MKIETGTAPETTDISRMDNYINSQLSIAYLTKGSDAKFIGFLQPYLSLKHKIIGEKDRAAIKVMEDTTNPGNVSLLHWLDQIYPKLRKRLEQTAAEHSQYRFVDLTLMFTDEQVFADAVHMDCPDNRNMLGNVLMAARMADEMVKELYPQPPRPEWRTLLVEGAPLDWQESAYLAANPDVAALIANGKYTSGFDHNRQVGFAEKRPGGFVPWDEAGYLSSNPDIAEVIKSGAYASGCDHYLRAVEWTVVERDCRQCGTRRVISPLIPMLLQQ